MDENTSFKTTDYGLASWLCYRGATLLGAVELNNDPRKKLIFYHTPEVDGYAKEWLESDDQEVLVAKRFFHKINVVKHALKDSEKIGA